MLGLDTGQVVGFTMLSAIGVVSAGLSYGCYTQEDADGGKAFALFAGLMLGILGAWWWA